jgi:hypothetical protein
MKKIIAPILILSMIAIFFSDLMYKFGNYDTPYLFVFTLYTIWILIFRFTSRLTFFIVLTLVVCMSVSYVQNGSIRLTERIGEWLYLFFLFGLAQYFKEIFHEK